MSGTLISTASGKIPQRALRFLDQLPYVAQYHLSEDVTTVFGVDFGAGDAAFVLATPATRRAKPLEVQIYGVSETFNSVTTSARVDIGDGTDDDEFALTNDFADGTVAQVFTSYDGTIVVGDQEIIEPGDQVTVTCVAPTGGTPSGRAGVSVAFIYFE